MHASPVGGETRSAVPRWLPLPMGERDGVRGHGALDRSEGPSSHPSHLRGEGCVAAADYQTRCVHALAVARGRHCGSWPRAWRHTFWKSRSAIAKNTAPITTSTMGPSFG